MRNRLGLLLLFASAACQPPALTINTTPSTAKIYKRLPAGDSLLVGTGTAVVKFDDGQPKLTMIVAADGFESVRKIFAPADATKAPVTIPLTTRVVKLTVSQPDAEYFVDDRSMGSARQPYYVRLAPDQSATVEIRRRGFKTETMTFSNRAGAEPPPVSQNFDLSQRTVSLRAAPSDGTRIEQQGRVIGQTGSAQVIIPPNTCTTVRVVHDGFVPQERTYCQRDGEPVPPESENFVMRDRMVKITTQPEDAEIWIDGKKVASGEYPVTVKADACVTVSVQAKAFLPYDKEYCNRPNLLPPEADFVKLRTDESWNFSTATDQANVNFTIDVGTVHTPDDAWKLLAQIATQNFDVIEVTDKETGYLRTGWNVWQRPGGRVIRTRVIVKQSSNQPIKYTVKLQSEWAPPGTSIKDDERFQPWDRVLLTYKDLINEAQARLR